MKTTLPRLAAMLPDEAAAYEYLERLRWNGEPVCPHCGAKDSRHYFLKPSNGSTWAAAPRRASSAHTGGIDRCASPDGIQTLPSGGMARRRPQPQGLARVPVTAPPPVTAPTPTAFRPTARGMQPPCVNGRHLTRSRRGGGARLQGGGGSGRPIRHTGRRGRVRREPGRAS